MKIRNTYKVSGELDLFRKQRNKVVNILKRQLVNNKITFTCIFVLNIDGNVVIDL